MQSRTIQENLIRSLFFLLMLSTLLCILKTSDVFSPSWFLCSLPLQLFLLFLIPSIHLYISRSFPKLQLRSLGVLLFSGYSICLSLLLFVFLAALKNDDNSSASWYVIFLPVWYALGAYAGFCVFMFPGMVDPTVHLTREAWILVGYLVAMIASLILAVIWLEDNLHHFCIVGAPGLVVTVSALGSCVHKRRAEEKSVFCIEFLFYMGLIMLFVVITVRDETDEVFPDYSVFIVIGKFLVMSLVQVEIENYKERKEIGERGEYQQI